MWITSVYCWYLCSTSFTVITVLLTSCLSLTVVCVSAVLSSLYAIVSWCDYAWLLADEVECSRSQDIADSCNSHQQVSLLISLNILYSVDHWGWVTDMAATVHVNPVPSSFFHCCRCCVWPDVITRCQWLDLVHSSTTNWSISEDSSLSCCEDSCSVSCCQFLSCDQVGWWLVPSYTPHMMMSWS